MHIINMQSVIKRAACFFVGDVKRIMVVMKNAEAAFFRLPLLLLSDFE